MSLAVVRCPACGGASRVPVDALGQMVGCPRCQTPFVAAEDAPEAPLPSRADNPHARAGREPARGAPPRPVAAILVAPPRGPSPELVWEDAAPEAGADDSPVPAAVIPDPEHDPHTPPVGGLPVSVLVGFALMPFGIPLLWLVAPLVTGPSSLSLAVPVSLAVAAAALCLGVVYTIDWTATTRIKGVLMLVGLAYLAGAGLYFLKKELLDRVQRAFSRPNDWGWVQPKDASWRVKMPQPAWSDDQQPLPGLDPRADVRRAQYKVEAESDQPYNYLFAAGKPDPNEPGLSAVWFPALREHVWFARVGERSKREDERVARAGEPITSRHATEPDGRQWVFESDGGRTARVVQVFVIKGRVYHLSAEGPGLTPEEEPARRFFDSFEVRTPRK